MNSVILIGRLTADPEVRYTQGTQMAVVKVNIAVDRMKDGADFPRITIFGKQAENVGRYLHKGSRVGIQGRIQTGQYKDKDGKTIYTTDVIADRVEFLSDKKENSVEPSQGDIQGEQIDFAILDEDLPF